MSTELVAKIDAFLEACSGPGITLYEGHPAVLLSEARAEITALTAKVALLTEALRQVVDDYDACSGAEPSLSVLHRSIDLTARRALSEPDKDGML